MPLFEELADQIRQRRVRCRRARGNVAADAGTTFPAPPRRKIPANSAWAPIGCRLAGRIRDPFAHEPDLLGVRRDLAAAPRPYALARPSYRRQSRQLSDRVPATPRAQLRNPHRSNTRSLPPGVVRCEREATTRDQSRPVTIRRPCSDPGDALHDLSISALKPPPTKHDLEDRQAR